ncbi:MAG: NADH-quinone oxidoreductase subunit NuoN [Paracoccaceae bacterium]|jgi:NADH-quinone oxidoreductase subunit N|tara:strand:+ start:1187 stop:2629 length:1443 start_codon:yes stop_codon:yes gene_type:complete
MIDNDLNSILPEIILSVFAMLSLLIGVYGGQDKRTANITFVTAGLMVITGIWMLFDGSPSETAFNKMFIDDAFSRFAKALVLLSSAAVLVMSLGYMLRHNLGRFEYPILIIFSVVGMMFMVSANDLMILYLGLELQSLALYVVASMRRESLKSTEAGMKYFVLGALSSGLLLYGASLVYGYSGSTNFQSIVTSLDSSSRSLGFMFGMILVVAGLAFKISAVPFHMWTPDVYEGAPTPITAFLSTAPKIAAMALFARVVHDAFFVMIAEWQQIVALMSVLSMFVGAIAAIGQTNIKRLMAYSSIAHMGYALIGLASGTVFGLQAMLVYMAIYVTMNVGTFAFILSMEKDGQPVTDIYSLNQLGVKQPGRALAMLVLLFSLAGVPPLVGFFGKLYVLRAAYDAGLIWLAVLGVLASVIGAYYYLRLIYLMYFGENQDESLDVMKSPILSGFAATAAVVMVVGIINLFGIEAAAGLAASSLVN